MPRLTVVCVLRSGGDYTGEWVDALWRGVRLFLPIRHRFVCLTDINPPKSWRWMTEPLVYGFPGCWSNLECMRPGLFRRGERVIYMSLDTLPVNEFTDIASYDGLFATAARDAQSAVMAWTPGPATEAVWNAWIREPQYHMLTKSGDAELIAEVLTVRSERIVGLWPGQVVSAREYDTENPGAARLVLGDGRPKFTNPSLGWLHDEWQRRAKTPAPQRRKA